jgi:hypothetical protein
LRIWTLYWDDNTIEHLWQSHRVSPEEIEEAIFGVDDQEAYLRTRRIGDDYLFLGETADGRTLRMLAEVRRDGRLRVFHAMDMSRDEIRAYRKRK